MRAMHQPPFDIDVQTAYVAEQSAPERGLHAFSYTITITNTGSAPAQLIARHWVIHDARGPQEEVRGLGVVGQQPLLRPGDYAFVPYKYSLGSSHTITLGTSF